MKNAFEILEITPKDGTLTPEQIGKVKGLGCLRDKRYDDLFNVRVLTGNGKISTEKHRVVAEAADRFGSGEVALTSRMTFEIQGVPYDNIPELILFLKENGMECGGTGPKVRPVVACKGTTCVFGLIDTHGLAEKIHEKFYLGFHDTILPHKFKIAVGGCPNNCVKPDLNDLGIIGCRIFTPDLEKCRGCKKCVAACPMGAISAKDGKVAIDPALCNRCGRCLGVCPFGVFANGKAGYRVSVGGRWGKKGNQGIYLNHVFESEEEVLAAVEKAILLFRDEGIKGERFAETVVRLGMDYVEEKLL